MKSFKQFLNEQDDDHVEVYHYSPHKFHKMDLTKLSGGHDQRGPGLYTSTEHETNYGPNLHRIKINTKKFVQPGMKVNKKIVTDLIDRSPHKETAFSNWHENPREGRRMMIDHIVKWSPDMHEALEKVWYDGYNADNHSFLSNVGDHFHGTHVKPDKHRPSKSHYVVWNEKAIRHISHD